MYIPHIVTFVYSLMYAVAGYSPPDHVMSLNDKCYNMAVVKLLKN
jgi:hypothetical protein